MDWAGLIPIGRRLYERMHMISRCEDCGEKETRKKSQQAISEPSAGVPVESDGGHTAGAIDEDGDRSNHD